MTISIEKDVQVHTLHVQSKEGDTRHQWDPSKPAEIAAARQVFDQMKSQGYLAYMVNPEGGQGEVIREFNPQAGAIIMTPQLVGG